MAKPLKLVLSLLLLVLSIALVTFVIQLRDQLSGQLTKNIAPFDMVVGAKGSPLQLVLSSVLHIDNPTGNISLKEANELSKNPLVSEAIPVSYGDNYKGHRILGTEKAFLEKYNAQLERGAHYEQSFEVVAGSQVAKTLNLKLGNTFASAHGLSAQSIDIHDDKLYTVTGILKPTGTVIDKLLITNLESIWEAHDHEHDEAHEEHDHSEHAKHEHHEHDDENHQHDDDEHNHGEHEHHEHEHEHEHEQSDENLEITSLLVKFKNPMAMVQLPRFINENTNMQAALPAFEVQRLTDLLGSGIKTINGIALAILLVSAISIFISMLQTIRERKQELALLRTYGLKTGQLLWLVILESLYLAFFGFIFGWLLGRLALVAASRFTQENYGYTLDIALPNAFEWGLLVATILITVFASFLASTSIFKLNISKTLSNE